MEATKILCRVSHVAFILPLNFNLVLLVHLVLSKSESELFANDTHAMNDEVRARWNAIARSKDDPEKGRYDDPF